MNVSPSKPGQQPEDQQRGEQAELDVGGDLHPAEERARRRLAPTRPRSALERGEHDALLLGAVRGRVALAGAGALGAADVAELDALGHELGHAARHHLPGAHVLRLLLDPDDLLEVRIAGDQLGDLLARERVEQLDAGDRDLRRRLALLVAVDVVVDLAAAEHQPLDLVAAVGGARVVDHELEAARRSAPRASRWRPEAQQPLGREDDERPRLRDPRLAAQQVEVLRRGGRVGEPHVALGGERDEALDAGARVLRARALVAVRQQQGEAGLLAPLRLARGDEAVDDHLGRVGEVAELRLPQDEALGRRGRVAVLEAQARRLRQRAVVELERSQRAGQVLDRRVLEARLLVVEDQVAVGERAALGVLAGEPDVRALGQQRGEGEALGVAELDPALVEHVEALEQRLAQLAVDREAVGDLQQLLVERPQRFSETAVSTSGLFVRSSSPVPVAVETGSSYSPASILARRSLSLAESSSRRAFESRSTSSGLRRPPRQLLGVDLADRGVLLDLRRHLRLRVGGLVGLVVAVAAVADQVDDDVALELLAVGHREPRRGDAGLDVVGVDVDDRDVVALRHVGGVRRRARLLGIGREAHLVVGDDVDRPAGLVALERRAG